MGIAFNADEILGMAEQIERNGQKFYTTAAGKVEEAGVRELLTHLAEWEGQHEKLFISIREGLSDEERTSTAFDPDSEGELYLQAMADTHVFRAGDDPLEKLEGTDAPADILRAALEFERDSILFFLGMKEAVPARLGPDKVDRLIKEEMNHVAYLKRKLAGTGAA